MSSEAHPAGDGGAEQQPTLDQSMPHTAGEAPPEPLAAVTAFPAASEPAGSDEHPPSTSKRQRRGHKEIASLSSMDGPSAATESSRPSRRAASAAQVAIAHTYAFEQQKGLGGMSPPRHAEQSAALRFMQQAGEHPAAGEQAARQQQPESAAGAAEFGAPAADAAAGAWASGRNGKLPPKKRKQPDGASAAATPSCPAAPGAGEGGTPGVGLSPLVAPSAPSQPVDLQPFIDMAGGCENQDVLRAKLLEKYPPTRGRAAVNQAFRDLFLALCPGQLFHNRQAALAHMSHRLFELAGKPVGKPPAPYKPRGPRSPSAAAAAAGTPLSPAPPFASGSAAAAAAGAAPVGPAAGLAAELGAGLGPAAAAAARAAATASGEQPEADGSGIEQRAAMAAVLAEYPQELVRIAALVRRSLGMQKGSVAHLRMMLKTNHLAGQDVRFQTKGGKILNHGRLNEAGSITCHCKQCGGTKGISASEFEEHSGSKDRRPADGIYLEGCNRTLKDLLTLINSPEMAAQPYMDVHMETCYTCGLGGELVCCDGCTAAYHAECVNLGGVPEGDWFCPVCVSQGITAKPEPMLPLQPKQLTAVKPPKTSGKGRNSSSGKLSKQGGSSGEGRAASGSQASGAAAAAQPPPPPRPSAAAAAAASGGGGGGSGRVHMAAPSAPRAPRLGRPGARSNKNKRLFEGEEGALANGQKLFYRTTQGETLLEGVAVVEIGGPSGILCGCCNTLISASGFEAHAGRGQRRAPYDNIFTEDGMTLKAMAALLPDFEDDGGAGGGGGGRRGGAGGGDYGLDDLADDAREVISELDTLAGGCVLCHEVDFQRGGFGPRTIMLCDQCEREFHVGCLKKCGTCELEAVPEGDWHCSAECERIRSLISASVQGQQMEIPGFPNHTWQVMRGKDGKHPTAWSLRAAQEILQESFDPIMDLGSNTDLLPVMLYARRAGEWDYSNCLTLLLRHKGKPVVAAICRVFGPQMAELPLIATKNTARRQGHARILVNCFEALLRNAGVHTLVLPAAHETVQTWKSGFSFADMPEDDVRLAKQQLRILIFPGTEVLWKHFPDVKPPQGHHILVPPPDRPSAEEAADALEVAAITANMVACVSAACGEPVLPETLGMPAAGSGGGEQPVQAQQPAQSEPGQQQQQNHVQHPAPAMHQQQQAQMHAQAHQQQQQPAVLQQAPLPFAGPGSGHGGMLHPQAAAAAQPPPPGDEYEAMIAQAMSEADRTVAAAAWQAPAAMDVDGAPAGAAAQQQPASSDEAVSSASDDEVDGSRQQDSGGSQ